MKYTFEYSLKRKSIKIDGTIVGIFEVKEQEAKLISIAADNDNDNGFLFKTKMVG